MLITFPDIGSLESRYVRLLSWCLRRDWIWYNCRVPHHVWEFTPGTACALFQKAGFEVLGLQRFQDEHEPSSGVMALLLLPVRLLRIPAMSRLFGTQMEFIIRKQNPQ